MSADKEAAVTSNTSAVENTSYSEISSNRNAFQRFYDGFKPAKVAGESAGLSEAEILDLQAQNAPLKRSLKGRHVSMIAIGGCIGSGLFIGTGSSLASAGPAGVIIAFLITGVMLYCTMHAMGELSVRYPIGGSFYVHSARFIDPSWGFAMGWNYAFQWLVTFPLELLAAAIVIDFWSGDNNGATNVNKAAWVGLFFFVILLINVFGVKGYGEAEFVLSLIKVVTIVGFVIFGIVIAAGGGPNHHYYGTHYWYDPGAFNNGFKGVISALVNAAFAFAGSEFAGLAAAETEDPQKHLPRAVKQVFWRMLLFYIVSIMVISCLVPFTNESLGTTSDGRASPFVLAAKAANVKALPSIFNAVILLSALSVANSSVYGCTRTVAALAAEGQAPKILGYVDREGRPLVATACTMLFGLLAFMVATPHYVEVFDWLLAFSGLSALFTWGSICLAHVRYRAGMKYHGIDLDEVAFVSGVGTIGSWVGFAMNLLIVCLEFWIALFPLGGSPNVSDFFQVYISVPVTVAFWFIHKAWYRTPWYVKVEDMDVISGTRDIDPEISRQQRQEQREFLASKGFLYRFYNFWC